MSPLQSDPGTQVLSTVKTWKNRSVKIKVCDYGVKYIYHIYRLRGWEEGGLFGGESHGFQEERRGSVVATEYKGRRTKEIDCQRGEDHNNILEPLGGGGGVM